MMDYSRKAVRQSIIARIQKVGKYHDEVSLAAGYSRGTLPNFLNGHTESLKLETAVHIANALGTTVSELIGEVDLQALTKGLAKLEAGLAMINEAVTELQAQLDRSNDPLKD